MEESSLLNDTTALIDRPTRIQNPVSSSAEMEILWFIESLKQDKLTVENRKPYNEEIKESPKKSYAEVLAQVTCSMEKSSKDSSEKKIDAGLKGEETDSPEVFQEENNEANNEADDFEFMEEVPKDDAVNDVADQSSNKTADRFEGEVAIESPVQGALEENIEGRFVGDVKDEDEIVEALGIFEEEVVETNGAERVEEFYDGSPEISLKIKEVLLDKEIRRDFEGDLNEIDVDFDLQSFSSEDKDDSSLKQDPIPMSGGLLTKMKSIFNFFFD